MRPLRLLLAFSLLGCTAGDNTPDGGDTAEDSEAECSDGRDNDGDTWVDCLDPGCAETVRCMTDSGPLPDAFTSCSGDPYDAEEAFRPVDIVWVVDTSGSMSDEAERVQNNMLAFATAMGEVGLDWRVVMVSRQAFVTVPPSLADDDRYLLVEREVLSDAPLQALLDERTRYLDFLRRRASTHFVAVTDDNSSLEWESFRTQMRESLGKTFTFHAIASERGPDGGFPPTNACVIDASTFPPEGAAAWGREYEELVLATGGRFFSICTPGEEWEDLFGTLTTAIAVPMTIPCEYGIPEPPSGTELDFGRVNVRYDSSTGGELLFPYVGSDDGAECTDGGWYYDDPAAPTRIILCPSTCSTVNGDTAGSVTVELGCSTFII